MTPNRVPAASALTIGLFLAGCVSTAPRPFAPVFQPPMTDQAALHQDFTACSTQVTSGQRAFGPSKSAVAVAVVGGMASVPVLESAEAWQRVGGSSAMAASGLALVGLVPLATYAISAHERDRNESVVRTAMGACLAARGRNVAAWTRLSKHNTETMVTPSGPSQPVRN